VHTASTPDNVSVKLRAGLARRWLCQRRDKADPSASTVCYTTARPCPEILCDSSPIVRTLGVQDRPTVYRSGHIRA
jgi:hypothetical protein